MLWCLITWNGPSLGMLNFLDARAFHCDPITLLAGVISPLSILPKIALGNGSLFSFSVLFPIHWLVHWKEHVPAKTSSAGEWPCVAWKEDLVAQAANDRCSSNGSSSSGSMSFSSSSNVLSASPST